MGTSFHVRCDLHEVDGPKIHRSAGGTKIADRETDPLSHILSLDPSAAAPMLFCGDCDHLVVILERMTVQQLWEEQWGHWMVENVPAYTNPEWSAFLIDHEWCNSESQGYAVRIVREG